MAKHQEIHLDQNFPNPFNPSTTISFSIPEDVHVTLTIFDVYGREVKQLADAVMTAGHHTLEFDGSDLASGTYMYRLEAKSVDGGSIFIDQKMMILVR